MSNDPIDLHQIDIFPLKEEKGIKRFFQQVAQLFKHNQESEPLLGGRINAVRKSANVTVEQLIALRAELGEKQEVHLYTVVLAAIDPLLKEFSRFEASLAEKANTPHQVKLIQRYVQWLEKAKIWTELGGRCHDLDLLHQAVIAHTIQEFHQYVDRDIAVIQEYLKHFLDALSIEDVVRQQLEGEIEGYIDDLQKLKEYPEAESLPSLNKWRSSSDGVREHCFTAALHAIDSVVHPLKTPEPVEEDEDTIYETMILDQLDDVMLKLEKLFVEVEALSADDERKKKACVASFHDLEEQVHRLNGDLRLPEEQCTRVEYAEKLLSTISKKF